MGRYRRKQYGRSYRPGGVLLPVLFCAMLSVALFVTLKPMLPTDLFFFREPGMPSDTAIQETTPETGSAAHLTSFALHAAKSDDPVETLASLKKDDAAGSPVPVRKVTMLERIPPEYDYTSPVPESDKVSIGWFEDAVLIGDSRMQGLILYCGLSRLTSYTYKGLTVDSVFTRPVIEWEEAAELPEEERIPEELWEDGKVPVMEALKQTDYSKVFIMLGINETGWTDLAYFPTAYGKFIDAIRADNPESLIYILSVFPVTEAAEEWHPFVANHKIDTLNGYLQELAAEKQVFFVDIGPAVATEDGVLPEDSGVDGIHLNKTYCLQVLEYLYSHTVPLLTPEEVLALEEAETDTTTE